MKQRNFIVLSALLLLGCGYMTAQKVSEQLLVSDVKAYIHQSWGKIL